MRWVGDELASPVPCEDQPERTEAWRRPAVLCPAHLLPRWCVSTLWETTSNPMGGGEHSWGPRHTGLTDSCDSTEPKSPAVPRPPPFPRGGNPGPWQFYSQSFQWDPGQRRASPTVCSARWGLLRAGVTEGTGQSVHWGREAGWLSSSPGRDTMGWNLGTLLM